MSTTKKNQQAQTKAAPILTEDSEPRLIQQQCFQIIKNFNDRLEPATLSDFKTLMFYCLHDAYMLREGATVLEREVATMYGLWQILAEIESLELGDPSRQDGFDATQIEQRCFEIIQMFNDRNIFPAGISECKNLIFHCLHDAYTMEDKTVVRHSEVKTMDLLWNILCDVENIAVSDKGIMKLEA